ncbi:glycoside hydrolase family 16 protein [Spirochaeta cellobiosiphila]|uniref:glycoside hydrolase family 16 protein n=1 Tax=Spirochaeta cellobiosiphila TaxID=504483 RepID=UPI0004104EF2|nr:glycoside hydrolase family 16 protein [Spirochaeta cellobiosiphila]
MKTKIALTLFLWLTSCSVIPQTKANNLPPSFPPEDYSLIWSDEFNTDGLPDPKNWIYDTEANKTGWYNNELQYYAVANPDYSHIENGKLIITARKEKLTTKSDYGGQEYTSARLITRDKASWTYGFIEVRAKLPKGVGTWPAIWMLGTEDQPWPVNGEIDIMEQVGKDPTKIHATIHTAATKGTFGIGTSTTINDADTAFHNYQLYWTAEYIIIGVDDVPYFTFKNPGTGTKEWPFDKPQYLILNIAIGGDMGGPEVDDDIFPTSMEVDYVRVYQAK